VRRPSVPAHARDPVPNEAYTFTALGAATLNSQGQVLVFLGDDRPDLDTQTANFVWSGASRLREVVRNWTSEIAPGVPIYIGGRGARFDSGGSIFAPMPDFFPAQYVVHVVVGAASAFNLALDGCMHTGGATDVLRYTDSGQL
jgi:hypothetical protein